ncbi:MAG TPA: long-chain-fatty-acid--CoA ligase [Rhizomicrobium sp.]|nr:long-chain-fatty-acid--CoA ligase [Rhizomicrobium sp.]
MQHAALTVDRIFDYANDWHGQREIVTRTADGVIERTNYAAMHARAKKVSNALLAGGIRLGDRVATLGWNSARHLEAWYGIAGIGAVCHTLNPRLFPEQIVYIINHAQDRLILADASCAPLLQTLLPQCPSIERIVFLTDRDAMPVTPFAATDYESWISSQSEVCKWGGFDENTACGLCYTSGTTGNPKGVLYAHRSNYLHAMMTLQRDALALSSRDTILLIVPMYHANAWGVVYSAPMVGAKLVLPGPRLDGASVYELMEREQVTYSSGVPTVWQMLLQHVQATGAKFSTLKRITVGGSACSPALINTFENDYGIEVLQGWGMTETSPLCTVSTPDAVIAGLDRDAQLANKLKQGRLLCGLELKLTDDAGRRLPHDGRTFGRLKVKGPTIARAYFGGEGGDPLDDEGFFDTGDISTIDSRGYMQITDRAKDVIKSGGEWISSIDVENIAMGHPDVACAAVIGVAHPKWDERPLLIIQPCPGAVVERDVMLTYLDGRIAKWWMPDDVVCIEEIPLGATGKIDKKAIRLRFADYVLPSLK